MDQDDPSQPKTPEPSQPVILAAGPEGWLVEVGVQSLQRYGSLAEARLAAERAVAEAQARGQDAQLVDLSDTEARPARNVDGPELIRSGQEEVFSETEVDVGRIEHHFSAGGHE
jgi:hypothetical protein